MDYDDFEWFMTFIASAIGTLLISLGIFNAMYEEPVDPDEQACHEHGGQYVKVFNKNVYYCKGAK